MIFFLYCMTIACGIGIAPLAWRDTGEVSAAVAGFIVGIALGLVLNLRFAIGVIAFKQSFGG